MRADIEAVKLFHRIDELRREIYELKRRIADKYVADPIYETDSETTKKLKTMFLKNIEYFEIELCHKQKELDDIMSA